MNAERLAELRALAEWGIENPSFPATVTEAQVLELLDEIERLTIERDNAVNGMYALAEQRAKLMAKDARLAAAEAVCESLAGVMFEYVSTEERINGLLDKWRALVDVEEAGQVSTAMAK